MTEPSSPSPVPAAPAATRARPAAPSAAVNQPLRWPLAKSLLVLFALAALAAWLPWVLPRLAARLPAYPQPVAAPTDLVTRAEFDSLKNQQTAPVAPPDDSATAAQLTGFQQQLADTRAQLAQQQDRQQQFASTIKGDSATAALQAVAPLFTLARLEDKLARGAACQAELDAAGTALTVGERGAIAPLAGGGPGTDSLLQQLNASRRTALAVWRDADAPGWLDKIRARLSALISISAPGQTGDAAALAYDQLRRQVAQGDDAGALATVRALPMAVQAGLPGLADALNARVRALEAVAAALARHAPVAPAATPAAAD